MSNLWVVTVVERIDGDGMLESSSSVDSAWSSEEAARQRGGVLEATGTQVYVDVVVLDDAIAAAEKAVSAWFCEVRKRDGCCQIYRETARMLPGETGLLVMQDNNVIRFLSTLSEEAALAGAIAAAGLPGGTVLRPCWLYTIGQYDVYKAHTVPDRRLALPDMLYYLDDDTICSFVSAEDAVVRAKEIQIARDQERQKQKSDEEEKDRVARKELRVKYGFPTD